MTAETEVFTILLKAKAELGEVLRRDAGEVKRATDQMQREQNALQARLRRTGKVGAEAMRKLVTGGRKALQLAKRLTPGWGAVAGAVLSVAAAQQAAAASSEFRLGLAEIRTLLPESAEGAQDLAKGILDLSVAQNKLSSDVTAGLYDTISAGYSNANEALVVLTRSSELATAGSAGTAESVDLVTTSLNAYRLGATAAADVSDIWFTTVREGKTRLSELAGSIGPVLPLASSLGIELHQVAAAVAAMTKQGIATPQAVTRLKSLFASLIRDGDKVNQVYEQAGKQYTSNTLRAAGLASVLNTLQGETSTQAELLEVLGGNVEALSALLALSGENADGYSDSLRALEGRAGNTSRALAKIQGTDAFKVGQAVQAAKNEWIGLGDEINAALARAIENLGGVKGVAAGVHTVAAGLGPIIGGLIGSAGELARSFFEVHGGIDLTLKKVDLLGGVIAQTFGSAVDAAAQIALPNDRPFLETAAGGRNPILFKNQGEFLNHLLKLGDGPSELADIVGDLRRAQDMQRRGVSSESGFVASEVISRQTKALKEQAQILLDVRAEEKKAAELLAIAETERLQVLRAEIAQLSRARAERLRNGGGASAPLDYLTGVAASEGGPVGPPAELYTQQLAQQVELQRVARQEGEEGRARERAFEELRLGFRQQLARTNDERIRVEEELEGVALRQVEVTAAELGLSDKQLQSLKSQVRELSALNKERILGQDTAPPLPTRELTEWDKELKKANASAKSAATKGLGTLFFDLARGVKSSKGAFEDFAASFLTHLAQMYTELLAFKALEAGGNFFSGLFGGGGGATPGGGGAVVGANTGAAVAAGAAFAKGGVGPGPMASFRPFPAGLPVHAYSHGGVASSPQLAVFGEGRKREAYVPLEDNRHIPVRVEGGGGVSVNISVSMPDNNGGGRVADGEIERHGSAIGRAVMSELSRDPVLRGAIRRANNGRG